jgi:hypothetical protein
MHALEEANSKARNLVCELYVGLCVSFYISINDIGRTWVSCWSTNSQLWPADRFRAMHAEVVISDFLMMSMIHLLLGCR